MKDLRFPSGASLPPDAIEVAVLVQGKSYYGSRYDHYGANQFPLRPTNMHAYTIVVRASGGHANCIADAISPVSEGYVSDYTGAYYHSAQEALDAFVISMNATLQAREDHAAELRRRLYKATHQTDDEEPKGR